MTAARRDRVLFFAALFFFALWLAAVGPARTLARAHGLGRSWEVGVAPNFFAGITFALWQGYRMRSTPWTSIFYAMIAVTLAEAVQIFIPSYTADPLDAVAGIAGALLAYPILALRARKSAAPLVQETSSSTRV